MEPVDRIFVHHEGAGRPRDGVVLEPYTLIIGLTEWHADGTPSTDYSTKGFNHVSLGICLTGDRHTGYPVTDNDLVLIEQAIRHARNSNWVIESPIILPHKLAPGLDTGTVCPGDKTMARWPDVVAALWSGLKTPPISPPQEDDVQEAIVYPAEPLPNGPMKGLRPTCHGIVGSHVLTVLSAAQRDRLTPALGAPVPLPLALWCPDGTDRHLYVPYDPNA